MIYDSWLWKNELQNQKNKISRNNKKNKLTNPSDSNLFKIERALLFSATVARVLI